MVDAVGWFSSVVLLATVLNQVLRQWRQRADRGASLWLFSGQAVASMGFTLYSILLRNWVFTTTNAILLLAAFVGFFITLGQRRRSPSQQSLQGL